MEIEEIKKSDRPITCEPPSEVIVKIEAILKLGALPVCELDEFRIISFVVGRRWSRQELIPFPLEGIESSICRAKRNSELSIVVNCETDAGARACGRIGRINFHSGDYLGENTSQLVSSDRLCVLRVIQDTARPAPVSPSYSGDRRSFCSLLRDSPRVTETYRVRSPP
ncbi:MAG: hypothetical protein F6J93_18865 [Oscillatoria sp. SIO1A7]|nr:hypothetical protein [Oscillatoria sp. SIO1A7]